MDRKPQRTFRAKNHLDDNYKACRANAKSVLEEKIKRMERRTEALRIIETMMPWDKLSAQEEATLWSYFIDAGIH